MSKHGRSRSLGSSLQAIAGPPTVDNGLAGSRVATSAAAAARSKKGEKMARGRVQ